MKRIYPLVPWLTLLLISGCQSLPCPSYSTEAAIQKLLEVPGEARRIAVYPLEYTEVRDRQLSFDGRLSAEALTRRSASLDAITSLEDKHDYINPIVPMGDHLELRAGPEGEPPTHVYELKPEPCQLKLVAFRRYFVENQERISDP